MNIVKGIFWTLILSLPFWVSLVINPFETIGFYLLIVGTLYLAFFVIAILRMVSVSEKDNIYKN